MCLPVNARFGLDTRMTADADLAMSASSTRNLKRVLPADHSDDEDDVAGNSSDEELELEQIENKDTFSPVNPYEHYIKTGNENHSFCWRFSWYIRTLVLWTARGRC